MVTKVKSNENEKFVSEVIALHPWKPLRIISIAYTLVKHYHIGESWCTISSGLKKLRHQLRGGGGIGRRSGLKIRRTSVLVGSSPTRPTSRRDIKQLANASCFYLQSDL